MSTLQVANIHLESTGNNRIQYTGSNSFVFVTAGTNAMLVNTSTVAFYTSTTYSGLTVGNVVITNTNITVGNSTLNTAITSSTLAIGNTTNNIIANTSGIYHTGTVNALSYSIGTSFTANSTLVNAVSLATSTNTVTLGTTVYVSSGGNVGISNTTPADKLHVQGNIIASGDITSAYSDIRLKDVISPITDALTKVDSLLGFYYKPNTLAKDLSPDLEDKLYVGLSAQDVQKILPEVVKPAPIDNNYLTVQYEKIVPLLIEAIKELKQRVEKLENDT